MIKNRANHVFRGAIAAIGLCASAAGAGTELPLERGFYVTANTACSAASNATLLLLQRDGIGGSQDFCTFDVITAESATRFHVIETCADMRDPAGGETFERVFEVTSRGAFRAERADGWVVEATYCPQSSLPEPWRSNDIVDLID